MHQILPCTRLHVSGESLNVRWAQDGLEVPAELAELLEAMGVGSAEQFASILLGFPSAFASLSVRADKINHAREEALGVLANRLDPSFVRDPKFRPKLGAKPPR